MHFQGKQLCHFTFCPQLNKESTLKEKNLLLCIREVDSILKELCRPWKQRGSHKIVSHCKKAEAVDPVAG